MHAASPRDAGPRVSVVIPNWNGRELLDMVLGSLESQTFRHFETIVVDNGSTDGSVDHLRDRWPQVQLIALPENVGFAAGVNRGIERARGELVALLNTDIELEPDWLEILVAELDRDPGAGSVACKMVDWRHRDLLDGAGDVLRWSGVATRRGKGEPNDGRYDRPELVFGACAGAALYRRAAFDDVGLFDERYFAYQEDVDWSLRSQLRGWRCPYVPSAIAYHMGSESIRTADARPNPFFQRLTLRNGLWTMLKGAPGSALLRYWPLILANQILGFRVSVRDGVWRAHLQAWREAIAGLPYVLRERRHIQRRRRVDRRYLETLMPPR